MTNYEKYKDELIKIVLSDNSVAVSKNENALTPCTAIECKDCLFYSEDSYYCIEKRMKWLDEEYKEPQEIIDWSNVEEDTVILVRQSESSAWRERNFAFVYKGNVYCYENDQSSKQTNQVTCWKYAKLIEVGND